MLCRYCCTCDCEYSSKTVCCSVQSSGGTEWYVGRCVVATRLLHQPTSKPPASLRSLVYITITAVFLATIFDTLLTAFMRSRSLFVGLCCALQISDMIFRVGHWSLFQNPTQPKISEPNPTQPNQTQPTKVFTRPNPTHHRHLVWHIRLYQKLYTTVTRHMQTSSKFAARMKVRGVPHSAPTSVVQLYWLHCVCRQ